MSFKSIAAITAENANECAYFWNTKKQIEKGGRERERKSASFWPDVKQEISINSPFAVRIKPDQIQFGPKDICVWVSGVGIIIAVDIYDNRQMDLMGFGFQLIVENVLLRLEIDCRSSRVWVALGMSSLFSLKIHIKVNKLWAVMLVSILSMTSIVTLYHVCQSKWWPYNIGICIQSYNRCVPDVDILCVYARNPESEAKTVLIQHIPKTMCISIISNKIGFDASKHILPVLMAIGTTELRTILSWNGPAQQTITNHYLLTTMPMGWSMCVCACITILKSVLKQQHHWNCLHFH